jgi:hypothetical protein
MTIPPLLTATLSDAKADQSSINWNQKQSVNPALKPQQQNFRLSKEIRPQIWQKINHNVFKHK